MRLSRTVQALLALALTACAASTRSANSLGDANAAVAELLSVDRELGTSASRMNVVDALSRAFADDIVLLSRGRVFTGRDSAIASLRAIPENLSARLTWAPLRGGISADARHGFTYGFMTMTRPDSTRTQLKYLAYWIRGAGNWKVAVYKRAPRPDGVVSTRELAPMVPERLVAATSDSSIVRRHAAELDAAERAFSDLAKTIGLGPAFTRNAAPDAMNMGGPQDTSFVFGPEAIGRGVGGESTAPSTISWGPERVLVASSGDLGVTIGYIVSPGTGTNAPARTPFFTVWRRATPSQPWRFVAE